MLANFDFDVIVRSLPYLFYQGMTFTAHVDVAGHRRRNRARYAVGADAAVGDSRLLALPAAAYVNLMRSIPFVMMIFWFYSWCPTSGNGSPSRRSRSQVGAFASCLVTFMLFEAA